jgi:DNA-binding MarR family transcriptional regulator
VGVGRDREEELTMTGTATTSRTETAARLRFAIGRLFRRLRFADGEDLTPGKILTLVTIEREGPIRIGDLAAREYVSPPTMTRIIQRLDEKGFVERQPDPDDGRSCLVALTDAGAAVLEGARQERTAYLAARLSQLPAEDVAALVAALPVLEALAVDDEPASGTEVES